MQKKMLGYLETTLRSWVQVLKQPLVEMQGKTAYIRPKVVGPFPVLDASGNYVHRATLYLETIFCFLLSCCNILFLTIGVVP
jgi:hypothetical protein